MSKSTSGDHKDLLRQTHKFRLPSQEQEFDSDETLILFELVKHGKVTSLAQLFQGRTPDSIEELINRKDNLSRTPIFYACFYNYKNIVLYLMIKGADPSVIDVFGNSIFHVLVNKGNIDSLNMIINYFYFDLREYVDKELHDIKIECGMKRSDVRNGVLKSPDAHLKEVQDNYKKLISAVEELYIDYYQRIISFHGNILLEFKDANNRTCLHYGSMGLHFHTIKCVENIMSVGRPKGYSKFEVTFSELQNLEVDRKKRIDPRRTLRVIETMKNFMYPKMQKVYFGRYKRNKALMLATSLDCQDKDGYTALHIAAFYGQYPLVNLYLLKNANTKITDFVHKKEAIEYSKNKSIMKAIRDMNTSIIQNDRVKFEFLLNSGFSIERPKSITLSRPIQAALDSNEPNYDENERIKQDRFLSVVLRCGADIDSTDSDGWTSLHHAAENGNVEHVLILLKNFANVNIFSNKGLHAIHIAAMNDNYDIVEILLKNESDLNARDNDKRTPLHLAAKRGCKDAVKILLELGAKLYARDRRKWTALHYAAFYGHDSVVGLLCIYDDDKNKLRGMKNSQNKLAMDLAKTQKTKKYFETLCNASRQGKLDIVRKMIITGRDPNTTTRVNQWTPLHLAAMNGHLLVVRYLLDNGGNPEIIDNHGNTPLDYAIAFNDPKVIAMIDEAINKRKVKGTNLDEVKEVNEDTPRDDSKGMNKLKDKIKEEEQKEEKMEEL